MNDKDVNKNRGQLSIFMGITMILVMSMLAFVINVGLFVKAKINLQNAVDAAAYSGASTQARQLTNIAYANWELRNTFKEWMFKYYVLGQIGLFPNQLSTGNITGKGSLDYRLSVPPGLQFNSSTTTTSIPVDAYNMPSICIHNNTSKNICPLYMIPGLPRFPAIGVAGITEIHEALVNKLVNEKATDCSSRSNINYLAAISWIYGSGIKEIPGAPLVVANRPGAWPQALELAMRIRNLEMIMNRPPIATGISVNDLNALPQQAPELAFNERPYKAYMSALRNLSGGKYKEEGKDEFSGSFKLYEIPPQPYQASSSTVSGFLIPDDFVYPGADGFKALTKHYVDLQINPVNYAVFYSTFTSTKYKYEGVDAEASCGITKTAIPVPGYILGYTKNPEVLTYYAVKGESRFIGMFYPFADTNGITLTAYAAAKPYGGRIGPKLFQYGDGGSSLRAREDRDRKSKPYISGIVAPPAGTPFKTGYPIPYDQDFWASNVKNNFVLGGIPGTNATPSYGLPNLIYDFEDEGDLIAQSTSTELVQDVIFNVNNLSAPESLGLFNRVQFKLLKNSLGPAAPATTITAPQITEALIRARRATKYDAINYLVPDLQSNGSIANNTTPFIVPLPDPGASPKSIKYKLFAPLSGPNTLYKTNNAVETVVNSYLVASNSAVDTYLKTLLDVAKSIYNTTTGGGDPKLLADSAKSIHVNVDKPGNNIYPDPLVEGSCAIDIASKFYHFFKRTEVACGIVPLKTMMVEYIAKHSNSADGSDRYYIADYYIPGSNPADGITPLNLMTAYYPGKRQGSSGDDLGTTNHPLDLNGNVYSSRRNYYSTKFIQLARVIESPPNTRGSTTGITDFSLEPTLRESFSNASDDLQGGQIIMRNPVKYDATSGINNSYFLEF